MRPERVKDGDFEFGGELGELPEDPFDKPSRWPGTKWMFEVVDDYERDYPHLVKHAEGYPTPEYLRTITKVGNVGYEGEMEAPTDGSELIRKTILDNDERTLYIQVWGGCNTIARALLDIEHEYKEQPEWKELHEKIMNKVVITACGEQDDTFQDYIAEEWPGIMFVKTLQMQSYAYPWFIMPEGESKDTLKADYMKAEILTGRSALTDGYCTWLDGHVYEGEDSPAQFGSNPNIVNEWFGARFIKAKPVKYDFLSEGDSPTYFCLLDWGFRTLENFGFGGLAGRYYKEDKKNSKGEALHVWNVAKDNYTDRDGNASEQESMWQYVADIQRDFAARVDWVSKDKYEDAEHMPSLEIKEGLDFTVAPGEKVILHANATTTDKTNADVSFKVYEDASAACAKETVIAADGAVAEITVPANAKPGDLIHVVVKAQCDGKYRLTYYQQVIITVK